MTGIAHSEINEHNFTTKELQSTFTLCQHATRADRLQTELEGCGRALGVSARRDWAKRLILCQDSCWSKGRRRRIHSLLFPARLAGLSYTANDTRGLQTLPPSPPLYERAVGASKAQSSACRSSPCAVACSHLSLAIATYSPLVVECFCSSALGDFLEQFTQERIQRAYTAYLICDYFYLLYNIFNSSYTEFIILAFV